jgi:hypothetical protein
MQNSEVFVMLKSCTQRIHSRIHPLYSIALAWTLASTGVSAIAAPSLAADQPNGDPPKTADTPFWSPAARLATDKPQRIEINNKTGVTLDYLITTHTDFRTLAPGKSVTLSNFTTPVFVNINPQVSNYLVAYNVSVNPKTNTLVVNVALTNNPDNRTLNIDETGAVYLY